MLLRTDDYVKLILGAIADFRAFDRDNVRPKLIVNYSTPSSASTLAFLQGMIRFAAVLWDVRSSLFLRGTRVIGSLLTSLVPGMKCLLSLCGTDSCRPRRGTSGQQNLLTCRKTSAR